MQDKFLQLDAIRGAAILLVIMHNESILCEGVGRLPPCYRRGLFTHGF